MPLSPVTRRFHHPLREPEDVRRLFEAGREHLAAARASARDCIRRDFADHLFYLGAIHPEWFHPLRDEVIGWPEEVASLLEGVGFHEWTYLLDGASDASVNHLDAKLRGNPGDWRNLEMLAAIVTPAAFASLARLARSAGRERDLEKLGFWIGPAPAPALPRFARSRRAIRVMPFSGSRIELSERPHPIGLPLAELLAEPGETRITWHYLSLTLDELSGMPDLPCRRLHLVSPRFTCEWTLQAVLAPDGRLRIESVEGPDDDELEDCLEEEEEADPDPDTWREAVLREFDDRLTYCNGHVMSTEGVVGVSGGPPVGLYPNPSCTACGRLMFHVATVESQVREYGDGFRSLYACETCARIACTGTNWN